MSARTQPARARPVYLTAAAISRLENGHVVTFQVGTGRGSVGRNTADGLYLWALRWAPIRPTYDKRSDTWTHGSPEQYRQGTAESLGAALDAIDAARSERP